LTTEVTDKFNFLHDDIWWLEVLLLNDLFNKLNILNLSLQEADENIITITAKVKAFKEKLQFWIKKSKDLKLTSYQASTYQPSKTKYHEKPNRFQKSAF
jgi:hypothetical protein